MATAHVSTAVVDVVLQKLSELAQRHRGAMNNVTLGTEEWALYTKLLLEAVEPDQRVAW